jgi:hypothetical protein
VRIVFPEGALFVGRNRQQGRKLVLEKRDVDFLMGKWKSLAFLDGK